MPLDDGTILAWIEGELAPERHKIVTRAIARQPAIRARADAMRLDRFTLRALGDERAPAGLLDGVADLLEREMLVSIGDGLGAHREAIGEEARRATRDGQSGGEREALSGGYRGAAIVHDPATGLRRVRHQRRFAPVRYALAAGLLMVVGAGAWFGGMMFAQRQHGTPTDIGTIARGDNSGGDVGGDVGATSVIESAVASAGEAMGTESLASAVEASAVEAFAHADAPMTMERARVLLLERRLIVRARMADLSGLAWIGGVADRVTLERDVPAELASAVAPARGAEMPMAREASLLLAGDARVGPPIELTVRELPALPERELASIVIIELDPESLDEAIRGLRAQRGIVSVELEESDEPLPGLGMVGATGEHAQGESGMFWWREASDRWTPSARTPIVFEVLR